MSLSVVTKNKMLKLISKANNNIELCNNSNLLDIKQHEFYLPSECVENNVVILCFS